MISGSSGVIVGVGVALSVLALVLVSDLDWSRDDLNVLIQILVGMARLTLLLGRIVNANEFPIRILNDSRVNFILIAD